MHKLWFNNLKNKKGFSILESIIAAFVLSVGIVAVMGLVSSSIKNSTDSRNHIIAAELAQEGVELVRNVRDTNFIAGSKAFAINFPSSDLNDCRIDKNGGISCSASKKLYYNNGYYDHNTTANETSFYRRIMIQYDTGSPATAANAIVSSLVSWKGANPPTDISTCTTANKCVYTQVELTDWK